MRKPNIDNFQYWGCSWCFALVSFRHIPLFISLTYASYDDWFVFIVLIVISVLRWLKKAINILHRVVLLHHFYLFAYSPFKRQLQKKWSFIALHSAAILYIHRFYNLMLSRVLKYVSLQHFLFFLWHIFLLCRTYIESNIQIKCFVKLYRCTDWKTI